VVFFKSTYFIFWFLVLVEKIFLGSLTTEFALGMENIPLTEKIPQHSATQHINPKQRLNPHLLQKGLP
jgi:hypothetical protein